MRGQRSMVRAAAMCAVALVAGCAQTGTSQTPMYFSGQTHASVTLPIGADHPNYSNWLPAQVFAG